MMNDPWERDLFEQVRDTIYAPLGEFTDGEPPPFPPTWEQVEERWSAAKREFRTILADELDLYGPTYGNEKLVEIQTWMVAAEHSMQRLWRQIESSCKLAHCDHGLKTGFSGSCGAAPGLREKHSKLASDFKAKDIERRALEEKLREKPASLRCQDCDRGLSAIIDVKRFDQDETPNDFGVTGWFRHTVCGACARQSIVAFKSGRTTLACAECGARLLRAAATYEEACRHGIEVGLDQRGKVLCRDCFEPF